MSAKGCWVPPISRFTCLARGIPTLIMFKGGNAEATKVGALSKTQLTAFIQEVV